MRFLRRKLGLAEGEAVFCYVNAVFAPGLDEGVGNLWRVSFSFLFFSSLCQDVDEGWREGLDVG